MHRGFLKHQEKQRKRKEKKTRHFSGVSEETRMLVSVEIRERIQLGWILS